MVFTDFWWIAKVFPKKALNNAYDSTFNTDKAKSQKFSLHFDETQWTMKLFSHSFYRSWHVLNSSKNCVLLTLMQVCIKHNRTLKPLSLFVWKYTALEESVLTNVAQLHPTYICYSTFISSCIFYTNWWQYFKQYIQVLYMYLKYFLGNFQKRNLILECMHNDMVDYSSQKPFV